MEAAEQAAEELRAQAEVRARERIAEADRAAAYRVAAAEEEAAEIVAAARAEAAAHAAEAQRLTAEATELRRRGEGEAAALVAAAVGEAETEAAAVRDRAREEARDHHRGGPRRRPRRPRGRHASCPADLRELSSSLRNNAERLLRDIKLAHAAMTARLDQATPGPVARLRPAAAPQRRGVRRARGAGVPSRPLSGRPRQRKRRGSKPLEEPSSGSSQATSRSQGGGPCVLMASLFVARFRVWEQTCHGPPRPSRAPARRSRILREKRRPGSRGSAPGALRRRNAKMARSYRHGAVAQLEERLAGSQKVRGSSPLSSTRRAQRSSARAASASLRAQSVSIRSRAALLRRSCPGSTSAPASRPSTIALAAASVAATEAAACSCSACCRW